MSMSFLRKDVLKIRDSQRGFISFHFFDVNCKLKITSTCSTNDLHSNNKTRSLPNNYLQNYISWKQFTSDYEYNDQDEDYMALSPATPASSSSSASKDQEFSFVKAEAWAEGPKIYSAHFIGDSSNYTLAHRHYAGNGRLKNADGIFSDWKAADWMAGNDASKEGFELNTRNGVVTVKKEGIYYIYSQVHYLDEHDINGYQLLINSQPFLQCTTMTETHHSNSRKTKSNTCFTGGITHLKENDKLQLKDIEMNRYSIFRPEKSFFGLMRIGPAGSK